MTNELFFKKLFVSKICFDYYNEISSIRAVSNFWFFFSLFYQDKKLTVFFNDRVVLEIDVFYEFLNAQETAIDFMYFNNDINDYLFANVHFFENISFLLEDFLAVKYYPQKLLALYKFEDLNFRNNLILNLVDFQNYLEVRITNQNQIPFSKSAFLKGKIIFSFYNFELAIKNLIITIKGNLNSEIL